MQAVSDKSMEHPAEMRERALRRVIENVKLSDRKAGERVIEAVRSRLADGLHRIIVTSADRTLPADTLERAFDALRFSGLVCAPGSDGEIALLGMSQQHDALLASIPWGTDDALEALLRAARDSQLAMVILPPVADRRSD